MYLSLHDTTRTIAEAMLAGPPDLDGVVARMVSLLDDAPSWLQAVALAAIARFGQRWATVRPVDLSLLIASEPGFVSVWYSDERPAIVHVTLRPPMQRPLPTAFASLKVPRLQTPDELAGWLGVTEPDLEWLADCWRVPANGSESPLHHYTYRALSKRDGRCRLVEIPKLRLHDAQRHILRGLLDNLPPHDAAHGFRKGRSIASYATPHAGRSVVIRFDLADFFVSIPAARIHALFDTLGYPAKVVQALTALCTNRVPSARLLAPDLRDRLDWPSRQRYRNRHLPQGAPTSPALANLCAFRLDTRLAALAHSLDATYTRYADDLAFSGGTVLESALERLQVRVGAITLEEGFELQWRKTRVMRQGVRQRLAGVVVNRHPNLARDEFDALKAMLTNCVRYGAASQNRDAHPDFRGYLAGRVAHAMMLNPARASRLQAILDRIVWNAGDLSA